jgi:hypothetical protein
VYRLYCYAVLAFSNGPSLTYLSRVDSEGNQQFFFVSLLVLVNETSPSEVLDFGCHSRSIGKIALSAADFTFAATDCESENGASGLFDAGVVTTSDFECKVLDRLSHQTIVAQRRS